MSEFNYPDPHEALLDRNRNIAVDYAAGIPAEEIAVRASLSVMTVQSIARMLGAKLPRHLDKRYQPHPCHQSDRNEKMCAEYLSGDSLETVGQRYGITRERVRQILVKNGHEERHNGFNEPRRVEARAKAFPKALEREEKRERRRAQREECRRLYDAGETYAAIAERMSHPITWVQNEIWATGGPSRNRSVGKKSHRITPEVRAEIARRYATDEAPDKIAADLDICRQVVQRIANEMGVYRTKPRNHGASP